MTIDMEEIYLACLKRNCRIEVISSSNLCGDSMYWIKITEDTGVNYNVALWSRGSMVFCDE